MAESLIRLVSAYRKTKALHARIRFAEELVLTVFPPLKAFIFRSCPAGAAEDVIQETLSAVIEKLDSFNGKTEPALWSWCYQIARWKVADHFREQHRHPVVPLEGKEIEEVIAALSESKARPPGERMDHEDAVRLLQCLKPPCKDLLWKRFVLEWDLKSIAEDHGLAFDTARMEVKRCLSRARQVF